MEYFGKGQFKKNIFSLLFLGKMSVRKGCDLIWNGGEDLLCMR